MPRYLSRAVLKCSNGGRSCTTSHGLFDADDLMALGALAETMTGAIHFAPSPKPTRVDQFWLFHDHQFSTAQTPIATPRVESRSASHDWNGYVLDSDSGIRKLIVAWIRAKKNKLESDRSPPRAMMPESLHYPARRFQGVAPLTRGCSAQAWEANSSESCVSKVRFISSSDSPAGGPEGLNTQAHSEQPHPSTYSPSIHTNSRDELSSSRSIQPSLRTQELYA
jgi:hypothetical protein